MAWVAVDDQGYETIHEYIPTRTDDWYWRSEESYVFIPSGSIEKLIGRKLTWSDEPVELKEE